MRFGRPRTLLGLILLGLGLVTLPLLLAVANAVLKLGQLTTESDRDRHELAQLGAQAR